MRSIFLALLPLIGIVSLGAQPAPDSTPQALSWTDGAAYTYDGAGNIKRIGTDVQVYDAVGRLIRTAAWSWVKDYVYRDGLLVASRQLEPGATTPTTYHYHLDHLGTPRQITDDSGRIVGAHSYHAFGPQQSDEQKQEPSPTRLKYTGHERDPELDYMHARYYDPRMGRFLSVDPVLDLKRHMRKPQGWNRYAYVENSPNTHVDPTGRVIANSKALGDPSTSVDFLKSLVRYDDLSDAFTGAGQRRRVNAY